MPWKVQADNPDCDGWAVVVSEGPAAGDIAGCHDTEAEAIAQQKALYANVEEKLAVRPARTFRFATAEFKGGSADVPRDGNGRWTKGGGTSGGNWQDLMGPALERERARNARDAEISQPHKTEPPGPGNRGGSSADPPRFNAAGQRENARGGAVESDPQAVDVSNGTKMSTRAPRGDERYNDGPEVENALRNTYIESGDEWDPPVTALEALGNPKNPNLGTAYKRLGEKKGKAAQDRLMHRWRTGQTLQSPRYDRDGNRVPDPWTAPAGKVPGGLMIDNKLGLPSFRSRRFRVPSDG